MSDCEENYKRCKAQCFDILTKSLAGGDSDAAARYKACCELCKQAKEICESTE